MIPLAVRQGQRGTDFSSRQVGQWLAAREGAGPAGAGEGVNGRIVAVVGPRGGVGRTSVACNLAVCLAHDGHTSVALLDARWDN